MGKKEMNTYHRSVPNTWWLKRKPYFLFMLRELTSVFVAGYCLFLLVLISKLGQGAGAYGNLMAALKSPGSVALHLITLAFVLYKGEERIPQELVAGTFYVGWIVVSAIIAWLVLGL